MTKSNVTSGLASFIISSDPQYPRYMLNNEEAYDGTPEGRSIALETLKKNYNDMQQYRNTQSGKLVPVLINGDITEFGDKTDGPGGNFLTVMKESVFPILGNKDNVLIGLGNHGYDNNVNDSQDNGAAGGMLEWFPGAKPKTWQPDDQDPSDRESDDNDKNFDWRHNFYDGWTGDIWYVFSSYAYAVEKKDTGLSGATFRFIQLNNYPEYARHFETGFAVGDEHIYNVIPSTKWLAEQLKTAGEKNQIVIVSSHQEILGPVRDLLESANVTLVCIGHSHAMSESIGGTPQLPIVNSGASFKGNYLIAEAQGENLNIYAVSDSDHGNKTSIGSVPLKIANRNVSLEDVGRYVVFEKDDEKWTEGIGAYVTLAKTDVYYMNGDGEFNDKVKSCTINRADAGTEIFVFDHPGDDNTAGGDFDPHDDDYAVITIKKTLTQPVKISSFENNIDDEFVKVDFHRVNGLNKKISRVAVRYPSAFERLSGEELKRQVVERVLKKDLDIIGASEQLHVKPGVVRRWVEAAYRARLGG